MTQVIVSEGYVTTFLVWVVLATKWLRESLQNLLYYVIPTTIGYMIPIGLCKQRN